MPTTGGLKVLVRRSWRAEESQIALLVISNGTSAGQHECKGEVECGEQQVIFSYNLLARDSFRSILEGKLGAACCCDVAMKCSGTQGAEQKASDAMRRVVGHTRFWSKGG